MNICKDCDYIEVSTHKEHYRTCIICNHKQIKIEDRWVDKIGDNDI